MKLIITGALGHIGSYTLKHLPERFPECEIVLLDNLLTQRFSSLFDLPDADYRFHAVNVLDKGLETYLEGAAAVINLAAITDAAGSFGNAEEVEHNNFNATQSVAQACIKTNVPLIHLSSTSVYGTASDTVDEDCSDDDLNPQSPYAECKLKEEKLLQRLGKEQDLNFIVCRFGTICGPSAGMRFHTAVNKFCWQAVMNEKITVWKTALHQKRPYLTLTDAFQAFVFILENKLFDRQIYNVLTDNLTVNNILEMIGTHVKDPEIEFVDTEIMNQLSYEVLNTKFKDQSFSNSGSIEQAIAETIQLLGGIKNSHGG
ncbi:MAG: NAD-dependent epimerase/dehydratase family protein [Pseudomonadales bacterium]|nr:NAD-dependent epimerase/dehydratase family protein [Pseudomonadales bacterium]